MLVSMISRLKAVRRVAEENARLARELEAARSRIADSEAGLAEVDALRMGARQSRARLRHAASAGRHQPLAHEPDELDEVDEPTNRTNP
jgi:hypothetical protein